MKSHAILLLTAAALGASLWPTNAQQARGPGRAPRMSPVILALDVNNDQVIDAAELAKAPDSLKTLDSNGDGKLTPEEYRPQFGGPGGPGGERGGGFGGPGGPGVGGPGRGGPRGGGGGGAVAFDATTLAKGPAEEKILQVLGEMNATQSRGNMTVPEQDGRILRLLTEALGAKQVVEIGTSIGYSGTWFALGLQKTGGKLTTFEIDARRAAQARENFKRAGVDDIVTLVEGDAHQEVSSLKGEIDILFLDADKEGYLDYLQKLVPKLRPGGLVIAHNMNQRQADPRFVEAITKDPNLETVFLNMETSGISVSTKKR